jgi:hypothetical protein
MLIKYKQAYIFQYIQNKSMKLCNKILYKLYKKWHRNKSALLYQKYIIGHKIIK